MIDRHSPIPFYQQLAERLKEQIDRGEIGVGTRLPSENRLCQDYGLSRATVRQAFRALESDDYVDRIKNRGVFAKQPSEQTGWVIQNTQGFLENALTHQNRAVTTRVLEAGIVTLPDFVCDALGQPRDTQGHRLVRLRLLDGTPALYSKNFSPPALIPIITAAHDVLSGTASFSSLMTGAGYRVAGARRVVRARGAPAEIAAQLDIAENAPVLYVQSTSWNKRQERFDLYETWVRSDVVPLEVNVDSID